MEGASKRIGYLNKGLGIAYNQKEKHHNKCQICQFTFKTSNGTYYSEAAHIKAISTREIGVDVASNILVLCPNHHKMLDYGVVKVISSEEIEIGGEKVTLDS